MFRSSVKKYSGKREVIKTGLKSTIHANTINIILKPHMKDELNRIREWNYLKINFKKNYKKCTDTPNQLLNHS